MTKVISTTKASAQLDQLIRTVAPEPEVLTVIGGQSKKKGTDKLTIRQIDREIAAYRNEKRTANKNLA